MHPIIGYYYQWIKIYLRQLKSFGLHPIIGIPILISVGIALLLLIEFKFQFLHKYLYIIGLLIIFRPINKFQYSFIKYWFKVNYIILLKQLNNIILLIPLIILLIRINEYYQIIILSFGLVLNLILPVISRKSFTIPSPFKKFPIPISIIFRNYFLLIPIIAYLYIQGIISNNLNVSIASIVAFNVIIILGLFQVKDKDFYVWLHNCRPKQFLINKIKQLSIYYAIGTLPLLGIIMLINNENLYNFLIIYLFSYIYIINSILIVYTNINQQNNIIYLIIFGLSMQFPPMLLFSLPYFYLKSIKNLNNTLKHDNN